MKQHVLMCMCQSVEHQLVLSYFDSDLNSDEPELYVSVHLNTHKSFWKRLWCGLKYAIGHRSVYGDWDEMMLDKNGIAELRAVLDKFENKHAAD